MKIGDRVSFLNQTGGGKITGFQGKNIVLVQDEDGFDIPTPINEVVLVAQNDYSMEKMVRQEKKAEQKATGQTRSVKALMNDMSDTEEEEDYDPASRPVTYKEKAVERKGGDRLTALLAFVPVNEKELSQTRFESYFVNDSNYFIRYSLLTAEGAGWTLRSEAEVEPNTKAFIEEIGREDLNGMERMAVQLTAYKKDKPFILKQPVSMQLRLDPVKFYKLHTFQPNDYFEQNALLYTIVENDKVSRPVMVDAETIKEAMFGGNDEKTPKEEKPKEQPKHTADKDTIVVDLHAEALLDNTNGMSSIDILNYQLKKFRDTLEAYRKNPGKKIIFIHGKGEGVLRNAIVNELHYRYKRYSYQDASFREYGYGATQVTIK